MRYLPMCCVLFFLLVGCTHSNQDVVQLPEGKAELFTHFNNPEVFGMSGANITIHHCQIAAAPNDGEDLTVDHLKNCTVVHSNSYAEGGEFGKVGGAAAIGAGIGAGLALQDSDTSNMNNSSSSRSNASSSAKSRSSIYKKRY